ncbi:hypothetical protein [Streptomyces sp. V1I6]|uniref:zinc finger domain-containing protein n=1 Tax=Streptomyces sp. V1I6 TaxID=3042273 RepID=UPI002789625E|nr:hypothetical protein [Streptomyces sp. V1I6]MDQ0842445.1 hypothetical protein [Streptomyces sp. V1I6]
MTPDDAAKLLAACAAFDNRQPSEIAKRAWAKSLHDLPLDQDCFDAVARYYGTPPKEAGQRLWIQPHDVRTHRQIIRNERLENFVYDGDPNETPRQYLARYRSQLAGTAAGEIAAPSNAPALEGGPHKAVARELAGIGREVPGEDETVAAVKRKGPLGIECPECHAPIGRPCKSALRNRSSKVIHNVRRRAAKGEPLVGPDAAEQEQKRAQYLARLEQMAANEQAAREEASGG